MRDSNRYIFRVDATFGTGAGHFKRCLTIANELAKDDLLILFLGNFEIPWVVAELIEKEIKFAIASEFRSGSGDYLIIDQYFLDTDFLSEHKFLRIVQIVDVETPLIAADLFLHLGADTSFLKSKIANECNFIGGLDFLPTRKFTENIGFSVENISIRSLLIAGGGTDINNFGIAILESLLAFGTPDIEIHVMSDGLSTNPAASISNIHFHKLGGELDEVIVNVDTVITTAGTSSWDFIANQRVVGIALAVDNQIPNFTFQIESGFALNIGTYDGKGGWKISVDSIKKLLFDNELRARLVRNSAAQIDLSGPKRVAAEIIKIANSPDL